MLARCRRAVLLGGTRHDKPSPLPDRYGGDSGRIPETHEWKEDPFRSSHADATNQSRRAAKGLFTLHPSRQFQIAPEPDPASADFSASTPMRVRRPAQDPFRKYTTLHGSPWLSTAWLHPEATSAVRSPAMQWRHYDSTPFLKAGGPGAPKGLWWDESHYNLRELKAKLAAEHREHRPQLPSPPRGHGKQSYVHVHEVDMHQEFYANRERTIEAQRDWRGIMWFVSVACVFVVLTSAFIRPDLATRDMWVGSWRPYLRYRQGPYPPEEGVDWWVRWVRWYRTHTYHNVGPYGA